MEVRTHLTARQWLQANGYDDVVLMIDSIMREWDLAGKRTRRNWWEALAGDRYGRPRIVAGRVFPVLASAQRHQGMTVTMNAIQRSPEETVPAHVYLGRSRRRINDGTV